MWMPRASMQGSAVAQETRADADPGLVGLADSVLRQTKKERMIVSLAQWVSRWLQWPWQSEWATWRGLVCSHTWQPSWSLQRTVRALGAGGGGGATAEECDQGS